MFAVTLLLLAAEPCVAGPPGTVCVPAATRTVGTGALQRSVVQPRFFIDRAPLPISAIKACIAARACEGPAPAGADDAPAAINFLQAERACAWAGKRLPAEHEWETAPAVGALSETLEWTGSWWTEPGTCKEPLAVIEAATHGSWPAALCGSADRLDPCDGAFFCGVLTHKVLRRPAKPAARERAGWGSTKKATVRCATSTPWLARFPSTFTTQKRAPRAVPLPPTAEQRATFAAFSEDTLDTPLCAEVGRSFVDCRDPRSYLKTNEPRQDVVLETLADLGGGYTGVGSDQNYTFVAVAKSEWAWLFDYDPNVVNWHRVLMALIKGAPDRSAFVALFSPEKLKDALALIEREHADAKDKKGLLSLFRSSSGKLRAHYQAQATSTALSFTWLGSDEKYAYVKAMIDQGRMRAFKGNMLATKTMRGIAAAARALGVPMRLYYPSNAHEFWPFTDEYRENVAALPFDQTSVVVQTISSVKTGFGQSGYWHYNVQHGFEHQRLMASKAITRERQLLTWRIRTDSPELTLSGMPSSP